LPPAPPPLLAHRVLLTLRDDPIAAMLRSSMREGRSGVIVLPADVERPAFAAVLAFLYTDALLFPTCRPARRDGGEDGRSGGVDRDERGGRTRGSRGPSAELVMATLFLGQQYCLPRLVALCEGLLLRVCDCGANAAALLDFAHLVGLPRLAAAVRSHAFRSQLNWRQLTASEGWQVLAPAAQRELCRARARDDHLYVGDVPDHALRPQRYLDPAWPLGAGGGGGRAYSSGESLGATARLLRFLGLPRSASDCASGGASDVAEGGGGQPPDGANDVESPAAPQDHLRE
jgi:hypothetical protein